MQTKLTLTLENSIIAAAKQYAARNGVSMSKMVEFYFKSVLNDGGEPAEKIPPITRSLTGIARPASCRSDKQMLVDALRKRHLP